MTIYAGSRSPRRKFWSWDIAQDKILGPGSRFEIFRISGTDKIVLTKIIVISMFCSEARAHILLMNGWVLSLSFFCRGANPRSNIFAQYRYLKILGKKCLRELVTVWNLTRRKRNVPKETTGLIEKSRKPKDSIIISRYERTGTWSNFHQNFKTL